MIFIEIVVALITFFYVIFTICFIPYFASGWNSLSIFSPIKNYNKWTHLNWFGIAIITLLLNVVFIPYAVVYWVYKIFTVGRKNK